MALLAPKILSGDYECRGASQGQGRRHGGQRYGPKECTRHGKNNKCSLAALNFVGKEKTKRKTNRLNGFSKGKCLEAPIITMFIFYYIILAKCSLKFWCQFKYFLNYPF
jgi:hypothetical protein